MAGRAVAVAAIPVSASRCRLFGHLRCSHVEGTVPRTRPGSTCPARSHVLVDGHDLGVELHRCAALLVRAEAGALDAAEGDMDVRAGCLAVDADDPGLDLLGEPASR